MKIGDILDRLAFSLMGLMLAKSWARSMRMWQQAIDETRERKEAEKNDMEAKKNVDHGDAI